MISGFLESAFVVLLGIGLGIGQGIGIHKLYSLEAVPAPEGDRITEDDILRTTEDGTQREVE